MLFCAICYKEKHPSHPERTFHRFPRNEEIKKKWLEALGPHCSFTNGTICSDHFLPEDFCEPIGYGYVPKRLLQDNAIPKLKITGLSMTEVRLQRDNMKEDAEQRVVVHTLNSSEKENIFCPTDDIENSTIKQLEADFDYLTQPSEGLNFGNDNMSLSWTNDNTTLGFSDEFLPLNYGLENIPIIFGNEHIPLNFDYESLSLNSSKENNPLKDGNENITDPDLKRIISGNDNTNIIDLIQECDDTSDGLDSTPKKKEDDDLETKLKRVVIKMPDIGLRSFTEDDFTSTLAWKIFVKFILHNRKEISALKHRSIRLEKKVEEYQKMFNILKKGGRIRLKTNF